MLVPRVILHNSEKKSLLSNASGKITAQKHPRILKAMASVQKDFIVGLVKKSHVQLEPFAQILAFGIHSHANLEPSTLW
jgi:hypothetical protein